MDVNERSEISRRFSHLSGDIKNYIQTQITEYQPGTENNLYLNENAFPKYEAGKSGDAVILDPVDYDQIPVDVQILNDENIREEAPVNTGEFIESVLEGGRHLEDFQGESVNVTVYPDVIANPEEHVGGGSVDEILGRTNDYDASNLT